MKFKWKLSLLVGVAALGLIVFGAVAFTTLGTVEVNGDLYKSIAQGTDIVADYVPPAEGISHVATDLTEMEESTDHAIVRQHLESFQQAHKDFEERHAFYMKTLPEGKLKDLMSGICYTSARQWFEIAENEFVPQIRAGNRKEAHSIRISKLARLYEEHAASVNDIVKLANEKVHANEERAASVISSRTTLMVGVGVAILGIVILLGYIIARGILKPLQQTIGVLQSLAKGDLTCQLAIDARDEIGIMAASLNQAMGSMHSAVASIAGAAQQVASASQECSASSQQISANAEETSAQANTVSSATEQVNRNLQTVATGAEELSASIREIAKNATEAAKVANDAVKVVESTNTTITKLGDSSAEIGQVIKVITTIAQQTNLLALNATIEAARAGEAGKGFAVVANEVKELATQTAKATEDISAKIQTIQGDTKGAVEAIGSISGIIHQINGISNTIASAVEEQNATTGEIARNVNEAAKGSGEIATNITGVAKAAESTSHGAGGSQQAAQELSRMSTELQQLVSRFKY